MDYMESPSVNGTPWDVAATSSGDPDIQNQHAEMICKLVNNLPAIIAALRALEDKGEPKP